MPRRGESIYLRKDGRWEARYVVGKTSAGKTQYRSVYAKTYREAKQKRLHAIENNSLAQPKCISLSQALEQWLEHKEIAVKPQTIRCYQHCANAHILPELGAVPLSRLTKPIIDRFLLAKQANGRLDGTGGLSASYVRAIAVLLQAVLDYAWDQKMGLINPIRLEKPRVMQKRVQILRLREQQTLEARLINNLIDGNLAVYLALYTGMRLGEICALRWDCVDLEAGQLHVCATVSSNRDGVCTVTPPKSEASDRWLPLTQKLTQALKNQKQRSAADYVFVSPRTGQYLIPRTLQYRFKSILRSCGLPTLSFHALRHTFATRWIECGMDVKTLSELLGHTTVGITLRVYVHSSDRLKLEGIRRMEQIYGQNNGQ